MKWQGFMMLVCLLVAVLMTIVSRKGAKSHAGAYCANVMSTRGQGTFCQFETFDQCMTYINMRGGSCFKNLLK